MRTAWWALREGRPEPEASRRALSAGALVALAAAAPLGTAAAAPVPYREARQSGTTYECRYGLDAIGPHKAPYRAQVRGEDLHALEELDLRSFETFLQGSAPNLSFEELSRDAEIHWWRLGGVQYIWWPKEGQAIRFDLTAVRAAVPDYFPGDGDAGGDFFLSPVPPADAQCTAIPAADLALPAKVVFHDETQHIVDGAREQPPPSPPAARPVRLPPVPPASGVRPSALAPAAAAAPSQPMARPPPPPAHLPPPPVPPPGVRVVSGQLRTTRGGESSKLVIPIASDQSGALERIVGRVRDAGIFAEPDGFLALEVFVGNPGRASSDSWDFRVSGPQWVQAELSSPIPIDAEAHVMAYCLDFHASTGRQPESRGCTVDLQLWIRPPAAP